MSNLKTKLLNGEKKIGVWGTGFIGFSSMANFANNGVKVIGYDVVKEKVEMINRGEIPIENLEFWLGFGIKELVENGLMKATYDISDMHDKDIAVHMVCIPTEKGGEPFDDILIDVIGNISKIIKERKERGENEEAPLVIVESTITPGRSDSVCIRIFKENGLEVGKDVLYGVAPRRDWFVSPEKSLKKLPRIIGGSTKETTKLMKDVLSIIVDTLVPATDHKHAEIVKSVENAYRHLDITFANQLTLAYPNMNVTEILRLAGTKWNIGTFHPSFGTGGYCIPLSSKYVIMGAERPEYLTLLKETIKTDSEQPSFVVKKVKKSGAKKVGILGLSYKGDIKVTILSPTLRLVELLKKEGIEVKVNDPLYTDDEIRKASGAEPFRFPDEMGEFDTILIVADHKHYRFTPHKTIRENLKNCKLILDNTEVWKDIPFEDLGIEYHIAGDKGWID